MYDHTPFSWDEESKFISSKTVTISVGNDNETHTVIPSKITLKNSAQTMTAKSVQLAIPVNTNEETSQMVIYQMYWKNPLDNMILGIFNAVYHLNHIVYVRRNKEPTEDDYDWRKTATTDDWISSNAIKFIISGGLYQTSSLVYVGILVSKDSTGMILKRKTKHPYSQTVTKPNSNIVERHNRYP